MIRFPDKLPWHDSFIENPHNFYSTKIIKKAGGGQRILNIPCKALAYAQAFILEHMLIKIRLSEFAHGYIRGRSILTHARNHVQKTTVITLDIANFFGSITASMVEGALKDFDHPDMIATLCTLDDSLPQGAVTSPIISNIVMTKIDEQLNGLGWTYSRYADDLAFSVRGSGAGVVVVIDEVEKILMGAGFSLQKKKTRIQPRSGRQIVTGIVVNEALHLPREEIKLLRAILHDVRARGWSALENSQPGIETWIRGRLALARMISREQAEPLLSMLREIDATTSRPLKN